MHGAGGGCEDDILLYCYRNYMCMEDPERVLIPFAGHERCTTSKGMLRQLS